MTFPTKFSERMRAAMFPQQNLKRREAAFCWARRRFAPAKCRNALLLSSKSAKLSFSQEKLLTAHCHEPAHISHQWTCESVSGSHLRERSDEGGTRSVAMIHRRPRRNRRGSVNTTCPSTRTNVRFQFAGAARTVLYARRHEQGAQRPERKAPSYLSPNQGIDPRGKGALTDGQSPSFISAPSGDIVTILCFAKSFGKHGICAHKVRHSCA